MKPHSLSNNRPIGIFDSGLGGLTVLKALEKKLPNESFIYFGDTAHLPYGTKSTNSIINYSYQISKFLLKNDVKLIIIACNTASSIATDELRKKFKIPIFGVIKPCVQEVIKKFKSSKIGVIGTQPTIYSNSYMNQFLKLYPQIQIIQQSCPLFVPLIEENWIEQQTTFEIAKIYLRPLIEESIDVLILGCTHYPIMEHVIQLIMGKTVKLIASGEPVAKKVSQFLNENKIKCDNNHSKSEFFYVTDSVNRFNELGSRFLGRALKNIKHVKI